MRCGQASPYQASGTVKLVGAGRDAVRYLHNLTSSVTRVRAGVGLYELSRCVIAPTVAPVVDEIVSCGSGLTPDSIGLLPNLIERIVLIALTEWSARRAAVGRSESCRLTFVTIGLT